MRRSGFRVSWGANVAFAFTAMAAHKLRTFLSLLGVTAGVATVIMEVSLMVGFNNAVTESFTIFGTYQVEFRKYEPRFDGPGGSFEEQRNRRVLSIDDATALKRLSTFAAAVSQERLSCCPEVKAGREEANSPLIVGTNPDYSVANTHFVQEGRFITDADVVHTAHVCVIGADVASALFPHRDPIDQELTLAGLPYRVIGLFERKGAVFGGSNDNLVAVPISAFENQFPWRTAENGDSLTIATVPKRPEDYYALIDEGTAILRTRRGLRSNQPNDFAVSTSLGALEQFEQITAKIEAAGLVVAGIALLVGGVGVMNIMLVNVTQRTREIGIRKALGATRRDIASQFLVEAVTLTSVGGAFGIAFGLSAAVAAGPMLNFEAATPLWSVLLGFLVSTTVGLVFGMWPAIRASHQDPIEALRYE